MADLLIARVEAERQNLPSHEFTAFLEAMDMALGIADKGICKRFRVVSQAAGGPLGLGVPLPPPGSPMVEDGELAFLARWLGLDLHDRPDILEVLGDKLGDLEAGWTCIAIRCPFASSLMPPDSGQRGL